MSGGNKAPLLRVYVAAFSACRDSIKTGQRKHSDRFWRI